MKLLKEDNLYALCQTFLISVRFRLGQTGIASHEGHNVDILVVALLANQPPVGKHDIENNTNN